MKRLVSLVLFVLPLSVNAVSDQQMVDQSRKAINNFGSQLKVELLQGMEKSGPTGAIQICHQVAAEIAGRISKQYGWKIGRTSLQVRNPKNAPDQWELQVLKAFEKRKADGGDIKTMEHYEIIQVDGNQIFRYMKAIPTGGLCLSCHGANISAEVMNKLDALYPEDQARGFKAGDIRGAFTITRPIH